MLAPAGTAAAPAPRRPLCFPAHVRVHLKSCFKKSISSTFSFFFRCASLRLCLPLSIHAFAVASCHHRQPLGWAASACCPARFAALLCAWPVHALRASLPALRPEGLHAQRPLAPSPPALSLPSSLPNTARVSPCADSRPLPAARPGPLTQTRPKLRLLRPRSSQMLCLRSLRPTTRLLGVRSSS